MDKGGGGPINSTILRGLNDKLYDKRKVAALEVEKLIKDSLAVGDKLKIRKVIDVLTDEFAYCGNSNSRKGGLIGLAATAIALGQENVASYLNILVPAALACFVDQDSRVRYYACESLYNISKVARGYILTYFNEVFDGLSRLAADTDPNVRNGAELLDRLVKDIVTESTNFDIEKFIPLLRERIYAVNPYVRQFLVSWVTVLDSVPDIELLDFLPDFLEGLFRILSDANKDIRKQTETQLAEFLREIKISNPLNVNYEKIVNILVKFCCYKNNELTQLTALMWIKEFIMIARHKMLAYNAEILAAILPSLSFKIDEIRECSVAANLGLMKLIEDDGDSYNSGNGMVDGLGSDKEEGKGGKPSSAIESLTEKQQIMNIFYDSLPSTLEVIKSNLKTRSSTVETRIASLRWLLLLHVKSPSRMFNLVDLIFNDLMGALCDSSDKVVLLVLEVFAEIASYSEEAALTGGAASGTGQITAASSSINSATNEDTYFYRFIVGLLSLLCTDKDLLEKRCSFIVTQLSLLLDAEKIFISMAAILLREEDLGFASKMVQHLNRILLTSTEMGGLRRKLQTLNCAQGDAKSSSQLFEALYRTWCHDPVATVSLCLLTQNYRHVYSLLMKFSTMELTVDLLVEIDRLVQMIESPIFTFLRLQLLEADCYPHLVKSLYGILMLLPQGGAFNTLKSRLSCIPKTSPADYVKNMQLLSLSVGGVSDKESLKNQSKMLKDMTKRANSSSKEEEQVCPVGIDFEDLLAHFDGVSQMHAEARKETRHKRRLKV
eukprot:Nk52_evm25s223 gene=Nk52_evmTU25s223